MSKIKVGLVQQSCSADLQNNRQSSLTAIRSAAAQGAKLVVMQELHNSHYFCQTENSDNFNLAERIPGPSSELYGRLAAELGIVLIISVFEQRAAGLYHNTAVVLEQDGSIAGSYRKMHIPDDPGYYEKFYFTPGDLGFMPISTTLGKLGVLVCWDQWYPEAARLMSLAGAELLIYPTAIGYDPNDCHEEQQRQRDAWMTVQRGHAIANATPLITVNRVGYEADPSQVSAGVRFWGTSFVAGCQGEILVQGSETEDEVLLVDIDLDRSEEVRRSWPFLRDRRIDAYQDLLKRFRD
jgi:N-carbamoylputrescine amidase